MGLDIVLRHAIALAIKPTKVVLGDCVSLCRGLFVPLPRLDIVLRDDIAVFMQPPKAVLAVSLSLLGQRSPLAQGCRVVAAIIGIHARLKIGPGGHGETDDRQHEGDGESESDRHGRPILGGMRRRVQG